MKKFHLILLIVCSSCISKPEPYRTTINLEGHWQFALDSLNIGESEKWFLKDLPDSINLPGTTDTNLKGYKNRDTTTLHLNRLYTYEGAAWYRKKINIPNSYSTKNIQLFLERSKTSKIWIDSAYIGGSRLLQAPQRFNVSEHLTPGEHTITIKINNDLKLTPYGNVHIYSNDTQTNWNGIIGEIYLEASSKTYISNLQVFPDVNNKKINIELEIDNQLDLKNVNIELRLEKTVNGKTTKLKSKTYYETCKPKLKLDYIFDETPELWSEYEQPLYKLTAILLNTKDSKTATFGMRDFKVKGTQFSINGKSTFLRGKHEAAVFPITGFPPMTTNEWVKIYTIAKSYGINHYRFHTYCPPEAAFIAADQVGIYLQAELPFWGGLDSEIVAKNIKKEGFAMLKAYANHPSFVMFSPGNEIWSGHQNVTKNMTELKAYDNRPLYTMGSNNNIGYMEPSYYSEFFVGARIPKNGNSIMGHTRLTHAFADAEQGGILNTKAPATNYNFDYAVANMKLPIISHEIGQYQIYPNYSEIDKYTGVLRAWNLEIFKERLKKSGMLKLDNAFQKASGAWAAICYKAEMETALRTKGFAGFQLLDLQDFPGQGTALVGVLDVFMDSKNVITPKLWKQSCNDVVILLEIPKYCFTNTEDFTATVKVANYSQTKINTTLHWEISKQDGTLVNKGELSKLEIGYGNVIEIGQIKTKLTSINKAEALQINLSLKGSDYTNSYPIWVYPKKNNIKTPDNVLVTQEINEAVLKQLKDGKKVLLFPNPKNVTQNSLAGLFPPDFWNYGMFKTISKNAKKPISPGTLGLLTNPKHPIFSSFPTDFHTNWQWFSILKASRSLILDKTDNAYLPIVQIIDNLERNHKLGLIFEFKVNNGKLLICMAQLQKLQDSPEAVQLYQSVLNYMATNKFNPNYKITSKDLVELLH